MKVNLDHLGYLGSDTHELVAVFRRLGFCVTDPAPLQLGETGNEPGQPVQTSSHIILPDIYIELTSVSPGNPGHHLESLGSLPVGIRLLVFGTPDAAQTRARLKSEGYTVSELQYASRTLTYGDRSVARFIWISLDEPKLPGTLTGWVEHQTRSAVFDPGMMNHPNTVTAISVVHHRPCFVPGCLTADNGPVSLKEDPYADASGGFVSGLELIAANLRVCAEILSQHQVPFVSDDGFIEVAARDAAGVALRIREPK